MDAIDDLDAAGRPVWPARRLRDTATRDPDGTALRWQDRSQTWAELDGRVDAGVAALAELDVGPGDRVAIVLGNVPAFVESWFAVLRRGAVAVPAAPALAADELRHVLEDSGAVAAVVAPDVAEALAPYRGRLPALRTVVAAGASSMAADARWGQLLDAVGEDPPDGLARDEQRDAADLAALVYTSGTTGRPRGAMLTNRNLTANQDQSLAARHRLEADDTVLLVLPLFHVYGLNVGLGPAVTVGATVVLEERFDPVATAQVVAGTGVTVVLGAPPMYVAWAQHPPRDQLADVRLCASGAAALPRQAADAFLRATGLAVREGYGLTEASPSVTSAGLSDDLRPGSVGLPLPGVELRLVEDGEDAAEGDPGEVWVRGPNVFAGYWQDDAATGRALTDDGWLRTGDVGVLDADGWLHLVDRRTDLVIVSGFNVYPREVERVLRTHPAVQDAAVVGVPHPQTGETVVAHVVRADGDQELSEAELDSWCAQRLARYKCPTSIRVADELPRTVTGKVRRTDLRLGVDQRTA